MSGTLMLVKMSQLIKYINMVIYIAALDINVKSHNIDIPINCYKSDFVLLSIVEIPLLVGLNWYFRQAIQSNICIVCVWSFVVISLNLFSSFF